MMTMTADQLSNLQHYYKLDANGQPVPCDPKEWSEWFVGSHKARAVARTQVGDRVVMTSFTSLWMGEDGQGRPLLWETIVLGKAPDWDRFGEPTQHATLADAHAGHERAVAWLQAMPPDPCKQCKRTPCVCKIADELLA
jgi:hypothetical protein